MVVLAGERHAAQLARDLHLPVALHANLVLLAGHVLRVAQLGATVGVANAAVVRGHRLHHRLHLIHDNQALLRGVYLLGVQVHQHPTPLLSPLLHRFLMACALHVILVVDVRHAVQITHLTVVRRVVFDADKGVFLFVCRVRFSVHGTLEVGFLHQRHVAEASTVIDQLRPAVECLVTSGAGAALLLLAFAAILHCLRVALRLAVVLVRLLRFESLAAKAASEIRRRHHRGLLLGCRSDIGLLSARLRSSFGSARLLVDAEGYSAFSHRDSLRLLEGNGKTS